MKYTRFEIIRRLKDIPRKGWTDSQIRDLIDSLWPDKKEVITEQPQGEIDGVNTLFTTSKPYAPGKITVLLNGLKEYHFSEINNRTIQLLSAPKNEGFTDVLECIYTVK